ncbi:hypothetical protein PInf_017852 [Phytophthora infestans]|nr:hypothetical protein PInf_004610 [Phytophthora infestans]KAI9992443.1 hypothetical protein PInf_017852 [Phytophthora infestans]
MSGVCSLVATFVVPGVGGIIVNALGNIIELCQELEENEKMCTAVYKRLQFVSEELSKISDEEAMRQNRKQSKKSFIKRLASNRKVVAAIQDFNEDIDELYKLLNLVHMQEMAKWKREWDEENNLVESLAMLKYEMTHKKAQNSMATLAMMKRTFNKITRTSGAKVPAVPDWFISSDDVGFDANDQFDCGSYGSVTRGTWGKGAKVVIKSLLMDDEQAKESFFKEVQVWRNLNNPHVVELFGACHVSTPAFFVCEDAIHGNFADHFMQDKSTIWRLFHQAAVGLDYIHSQKVVHEDLKCNNILIGADDNAKICDFGFSYIRSQSVGLSKKAQTDTVRWKAPNV